MKEWNTHKVKRDCFAYRDHPMRGERCNALKSMECGYGECSFYKPKESRCKGCRYEDSDVQEYACVRCDWLDSNKKKTDKGYWEFKTNIEIL